MGLVAMSLRSPHALSHLLRRRRLRDASVMEMHRPRPTWMRPAMPWSPPPMPAWPSLLTLARMLMALIMLLATLPLVPPNMMTCFDVEEGRGLADKNLLRK